MRYHMEADGTGYRERTIAGWILDESTLKQLGVLSMPFAANSEHVEWVYARVRHTDGTTTETPVSGAMEIVEPVTREAPFYSDLKQSQLPLKDLRVGDRLEWQAKVVRTKAEAPGEFWGQEALTRDVVTLSETIELEAPKDKALTVWSPGLKSSESVVGDERTWKWQWVNKKPTVGAEADAAKEAEKKRVRTPAEELDDREGKLPDIAWTTFKDWEAVGAWYRGMEGDRMEPDADIKAKVTQITAGKTTEQEKVQAVYTYVATQIHYIGVAFGIGRYQPHRADDVLANQYGDCKDKHTLLASMLTALGLKPDAVLIGAGIRFNPAVPSPESFNHLITRVDLDGKETWLDTTAEVAPFGMLTFPTRDHEALVIPAAGSARIVTTPATAPFAQTTTMKAVGKLDADGTSNSRLTLTVHGDAEILIRTVLRQISAAQYDQLAQNLCSGMGYSGTASHLATSRPDDLSTPLELSFDYKREKAGDWPNLKTVPQLVPVSTAPIDEKNPPIEAIALGATGTVDSDSEMKLPDGWGAEMPVAIHEKSPWMTYDLTYRFDKGTMYAHRRVEVLQERVPQADWKAYGKFIDKAGLNEVEYVQLTRPVSAKPNKSNAKKEMIEMTPAPDAGSMSESEKITESRKLVVQAYAALEIPDVAFAEHLLDHAKALNPDTEGLWGTYGYLDYRKGDMEEAIKAYEKELALHPSNVGTYQPLANSLVVLKRRADAEDALRRWETAAPEDSRPTLRLAGMQYQDAEYTKALTTLEAGLARTAPGEKKDEQMELLLGRAQLKAGAKDKGHATLVALLKDTDNPDVMNDAAYELADAGLELPLAEQTTKAALDKMEQQSQTWTLDESAQTLRARTRMMQATWDTMGWVYFRNGKIKEAQEYIGAAWQGRQDAEVGTHLAEIEAAEGNRNAALEDYEMAKETMPKYDMMGVHTEPDAASKELNAKMDALRDHGAHSQSLDPRTALTKLRTVSLGPANGLNGVAEYKLLVSKDAVLRVEPIGTKTLAGGDARLKGAKLSALIPAHSKGQIVVAGMLNCHSKVCELVLEP